MDPTFIGLALEVAAVAALGCRQWYGWGLMVLSGAFWFGWGALTTQYGLMLTPVALLPLNVYFARRWRTA